jgi:hypothetical protein
VPQPSVASDSSRLRVTDDDAQRALFFRKAISTVRLTALRDWSRSCQ